MLTGCSPVLLVSGIERSLAFYRDGLGFECDAVGEPPSFVVARRDAAIVLLSLAPASHTVVPNWHVVEKMWDAYIRVDDAEAIYAEIQERGTAIDYSLYDAPHGFREFGVTDPDGHDLAFGQPLS